MKAPNSSANISPIVLDNKLLLSSKSIIFYVFFTHNNFPNDILFWWNNDKANFTLPNPPYPIINLLNL